MKMNSLNLILSSIFILSFSSANSQIFVPGSEELLAKLRLNESNEGIRHTQYTDIIGDPYLYKDFHPGEVIFKTGEKYKADIRYDIYSELIQIRYNDNVFGISQTGNISRIIVDTLTFIYNEISRPGKQSPLSKPFCFIVRIEGRCMLLIRKHLRIQDPEPPKLYQDAKPAKFIHLKELCYLKTENSNAVKIQKIKDLLSVCNDKQEELKQFIRTNRLDISKIEHLEKIVTFYNNL